MICQSVLAQRAGAARSALVVLATSALLASGASAQDNAWKVNEKEYLEKPGANLLVFSNEYNGMFFDEKTSGIDLILHEVRIATGGAVRLKPAPEQWDAIPKLVERKVDKATNTIEVTLRYEAYDFDSRVVVTPQGPGVSIAVFVDKPVPADARRTRRAQHGVPAVEVLLAHLRRRWPTGHLSPTAVRTVRGEARRHAGPAVRGLHHVRRPGPQGVRRAEALRDRQDLRARTGGPRAPRHHQGRRSANCSSSTGATSRRTAGSWSGRCCRRRRRARWRSGTSSRTRFPGWKRAPVIGYSQAGYHPSEKKVAVIELDPRDTPQATATLFEVKADGTTRSGCRPRWRRGDRICATRTSPPTSVR